MAFSSRPLTLYKWNGSTEQMNLLGRALGAANEKCVDDAKDGIVHGVDRVVEPGRKTGLGLGKTG
jgi:hypothetical protein